MISLRARTRALLLVTAAATAITTFPIAALAQAPAAPAQETPKFDLVTNQMVIFNKGAKFATLGGEELKKATAAHEAHVEQLLLEGVALIGGTIEGDGPMREVVVLAVKSPEEAKARFADDPIVRSERLALEVIPWSFAKGILKKPAEPSETVTCVLGFFRQGTKVAEGAPKPQDLMKGHLANITHMADIGDLVIAGPLGAGSDRRGVLVFRITDEKRIRELVNEDPMMKAGHLTLDLFRWNVPEGSLPAREERK